jgi:hypothetical protein
MNLPSGDDLYEKGKNISWKSYEAWIENQLQGMRLTDATVLYIIIFFLFIYLFIYLISVFINILSLCCVPVSDLLDIIKTDVKRKTNEMARRSINSGY